MSAETSLLLVLATITAIVAVRAVADRTGLPAAALLTLVGLAYALVPGPNLHLDPNFVLTFILPPLLYNAALDSSLLAIRRNLRTVVSLSVLLVLATAMVIGVVFDRFVAGATLAAGVALGAAVAPPDPVAALAVGRRTRLPMRLITLIQGEGLLNDATALTTLSVAVAAVNGRHFSFSSAAGEFVLAAAGGVLVGVVVARVRLLRPLGRDPLIANAVSLATPFLAYLLGQTLRVSGVLAVVVAGLVVGHHSSRSSTSASRLQTNAVWRLVDFVLEGIVFLLIGQQLPEVLRGLRPYHTTTIVAAAVGTVATVLLLRPLWLVLTQVLPRSLHTRLGGGQEVEAEGDGETGGNDPDGGGGGGGDRGGGGDGDRSGPSPDRAGPPQRLARRRLSGRLSGREVVALSWSGTRGVISLAAIFTLPLTVRGGAGFPDRDLLLFCAYLVVLVTLVGQGLTFAPLVRALGLHANESDEATLRNQARSASVRAALVYLDQGGDPDVKHLEPRVLDGMRAQLRGRLARYQGRLDLIQAAESGELPVSPEYEAAVRVRRAVIDAQREELLRWRDSGQLPDEALRTLERELDHEERMLPERPSR